MTKLKPKTWKGHCPNCALNSGKVKGSGERKYPWAFQRRLGQKRRFKKVSADD